MHFNLRNRLIYLLVSGILIFAVTAYNVYQEIKITSSYLSDTFKKMSNEIEIITEDLKIKANQVKFTMDYQDVTYADPKTVESLKIHTYPERGVEEYGFNQGIYPKEAALGSLYGQGPIPENLNKRNFLALDTIWSGYRVSLLPTLSVLINYDERYFYTNSLLMNATLDKPSLPWTLSPQRYRDQLGDSYKTSVEKYDFFTTRPFEATISKYRRVFFIIPIFYNGQLVADFSTSIILADLVNILDLYPELDESVEVHLHYENGIDVTLSETIYNTISVYSFDYDLPGELSVSAEYDLFYFLKQEIQLFLTLCVLSTLLFGYFVSIENRKINRERLKEQLDRDPMTQLYNRRAVDGRITQKIREKKQQENFSVNLVAIDADKFKQINDTYGHVIGDKAILHIAETMKKYTRDEDFCIRMGGDEFMIVLFDVTSEQATDIAERLCQQIRQTSKDVVGVEFGVTHAIIQLTKDEVFDQAYKRVDDSLYHNKRSD